MGKAAQQPRVERELYEVVRGFEELSFVEFPLVLLSKRVPENIKTVRFEDHIPDRVNKSYVERRVTLDGSAELGLPHYLDMDVLLAMFKHSRENGGVSIEPVRFTLYQICKHLKWQPDGRNCNRVKAALRRWHSTTIRMENSLRVGNRWRSETGFHMITYYELTKGEDFNPEEPHKEQTFEWHRVVVDSFRDGIVKKLDWDFHLSLTTPSAKRLHRYLDKKFYNSNHFKMDLVHFCRNKMGFSPSYKPGRYRELLSPAAEELKEKGFLSSYKFERKQGGYVAYFRKQSRKKTDDTVFREETNRSHKTNLTGVARRLVDLGVSPAVAVRLSEEDSRECEQQIRYLEFKTSQGWKPNKGNGAYLNWAITTKAPAPTDYICPEAAEAKREAGRMIQRRDAARRRALEQSNLAQDNAEKSRVNDFLESLTVEQREAVEGQALVDGSSFHIDRYNDAMRSDDKASAELYREMTIHKYVKQLINSNKLQPKK